MGRMASFLAGGTSLLAVPLGARLLPACADPNLFTDTNSTPGDGGEAHRLSNLQRDP